MERKYFNSLYTNRKTLWEKLRHPTGCLFIYVVEIEGFPEIFKG